MRGGPRSWPYRFAASGRAHRRFVGIVARLVCEQGQDGRFACCAGHGSRPHWLNLEKGLGMTTSPVAAADVMDVLGRHMLTDGYDLVLDTAASRGAWLVDAR